MRRNWLLAGVGVIVIAVLIYAYVDGGREPVREIIVPIAVPESTR